MEVSRLDQINVSIPKMPWLAEERDFEPRCHWGQRKLLFSELQFLLEVRDESGDSEYTCIYVGAASGAHLPILFDLFPKVSWILYDPNEFHADVVKHTRASVRRRMFTDAECESVRGETSGKRLLFVCDMRVATKDIDVERDMADQMRWVTVLQPVGVSLKFRLPFGKVSILRGVPKGMDARVDPQFDAPGASPHLAVYLEGKIYGQVNAPPNSAEARLVVHRPPGTPSTFDVRTYDITNFEELMQGYNFWRRNNRYQVSVGGCSDIVALVPGFDNGMESCTEAWLIERYATLSGVPALSLARKIETELAALTGRNLFSCSMEVYGRVDDYRMSKRLTLKSVHYAMIRACVRQSLYRKQRLVAAATKRPGKRSADAIAWCKARVDAELLALDKMEGRIKGGGRRVVRGGGDGGRLLSMGSYADSWTHMSTRDTLVVDSHPVVGEHLEYLLKNDAASLTRFGFFPSPGASAKSMKTCKTRFDYYYGEVWRGAAGDLRKLQSEHAEVPPRSSYVPPHIRRIPVAESSAIDPSIPCFLRNRRHAPFSAKQADDEIIKLHKTVVDGYRSLMDDRSLTADDRAKLEAATSLVDADGRIDDQAVVAMSDSDSLFVQKVIDRCGRDNTGEVDMSWDGPRVFMLYSRMDCSLSKVPNWPRAYSRNPWPPMTWPFIHPWSWNPYINKAVVSRLARRDLPIAVHISLPEPVSVYRIAMREADTVNYVGFINVPMRQTASAPQFAERCDMSGRTHRLFVFTTADESEASLASFRNYSVNWGDVVERRPILHLEMVQMAFTVAESRRSGDSADLIQVYAVITGGSDNPLQLVVGRKMYFEEDIDWKQHRKSAKEIFKDWNNKYILPCRAFRVEAVYRLNAAGRAAAPGGWSRSTFVPVWITWGTDSQIGLCLHEKYNDGLDEHDSSIPRSVSHRMLKIARGGSKKSVDGRGSKTASATRHYAEELSTIKNILRKLPSGYRAPALTQTSDAQIVHATSKGSKLRVDGRRVKVLDTITTHRKCVATKVDRFNWNPTICSTLKAARRCLLFTHNLNWTEVLLRLNATVHLVLSAPSVTMSSLMELQRRYVGRLTFSFGGASLDANSLQIAGLSVAEDADAYDLMLLDPGVAEANGYAEAHVAVMAAIPRLLKPGGAMLTYCRLPENTRADETLVRTLSLMLDGFAGLETFDSAPRRRTDSRGRPLMPTFETLFMGYTGAEFLRQEVIDSVTAALNADETSAALKLLPPPVQDIRAALLPFARQVRFTLQEGLRLMQRGSVS
jgi:hypothetical protein